MSAKEAEMFPASASPMASLSRPLESLQSEDIRKGLEKKHMVKSSITHVFHMSKYTVLQNVLLIPKDGIL